MFYCSLTRHNIAKTYGAPNVDFYTISQILYIIYFVYKEMDFGKKLRYFKST